MVVIFQVWRVWVSGRGACVHTLGVAAAMCEVVDGLVVMVEQLGICRKKSRELGRGSSGRAYPDVQKSTSGQRAHNFAEHGRSEGQLIGGKWYRRDDQFHRVHRRRGKGGRSGEVRCAHASNGSIAAKGSRRKGPGLSGARVRVAEGVAGRGRCAALSTSTSLSRTVSSRRCLCSPSRVAAAMRRRR